MPKIYEVGGAVRDRILGVDCKDIDFTFVLDNTKQTVESGFKEMEKWLGDNGFTIYNSTPKFYTVKAKFPKGHKHEGLTADFVMARKEIGYYEGTRNPILELGTLEDDLIRRDFTLNAMALDENGNIIDLFNGIEHLKQGILQTPKPSNITFEEDPLRICRCCRFCITKGFIMMPSIEKTIREFDYDTKMYVVSNERIMDELSKCFKFDTFKTITMLNKFPELRDYIFKNNKFWLKPTTANK